MREYSVIPTFRGPLAAYLTKFLAEKHAVGFRYRIQTTILQAFDRFLQETGLTDVALPQSCVEAWTAKRASEQPATHEYRVSLTREVARYLQRQGIEAYVPAARMSPQRVYTYQPYIFTSTEVQTLLTAVEELPPHHSTPYRHQILPVIFQILYGCGLRLGEVLPLRWRAVDLAHGILVLRDAKGHQDRLVPMAASVTQYVQQYARLNITSHAPDALVFPAPDGGPYSGVRIYALFRRALWAAGISHGGRGRGPRIHDLRHTFAVHRLMAWYRAGVDINAMLPVLATYMGHRSIQGTQRYLRLTAELYPDLITTLDLNYGHVVPGKDAQ